ncbi:MAG: hypothetical protein ACTFAK_07990 [Candidatus Electronema sp. VV]
MAAIPNRARLAELTAQHPPRPPRPPLTGAERERNLRVLNAFDLEVCCRKERCTG